LKGSISRGWKVSRLDGAIQLINMQLLGGYRHQAMDARLIHEPKTLDLSNFVPDGDH
jgi:hypothetical protein